MDPKQSIFNKSTIDALQGGTTDGNVQSQSKLFGGKFIFINLFFLLKIIYKIYLVGPRFDKFGELVSYSIVGKSDWFSKQENKLINVNIYIKFMYIIAL